MKHGDWLILILSLLLVPLSWSMTHKDSSVVTAIEVSVADQSPTTYNLQNDQKITVKGKLGDSIIEVHDGRVRMLSSPCNGKICVLSGWHQHGGDSIVCLPNKVSVSLISQQERFDGINF